MNRDVCKEEEEEEYEVKVCGNGRKDKLKKIWRNKIN